MKIDVNQTVAEGKNEFEILYNDVRQYTAVLPFLQISGVQNLDKLQSIRVFDLEQRIKYKSTYNYIGNQIEQMIPMKYLITNSQKFHEFCFRDELDCEKFAIYFEMKDLMNGSFVIKANGHIYNCYSVEDGQIRHLCIYEDEVQIGELLKSNVVLNGKDTYRIYLKDEYAFLADAVSLLALYLDRICYNSGWLKNKSQKISYKKTYSKANAYYHPDWVSNNFDASDFYEAVQASAAEVKSNFVKLLRLVLIVNGVGWLIALAALGIFFFFISFGYMFF